MYYEGWKPIIYQQWILLRDHLNISKGSRVCHCVCVCTCMWLGLNVCVDRAAEAIIS